MDQSVLDEMGTIAFIWEAYAQLIRRGNDRNMEHKIQQRKALLDKFLDHFIHLSLKEKGGISFGEMRNIANEVSQEFMRNVENVTRHVSEEDATYFLEDYMLRGRGWRLLYVVQQVGLKGVSQRQDLCQVLISLLPYCAHMTPHSPSDLLSQDHLKNGTSSTSSSSSGRQLGENLSVNFYSCNSPLNSCFQLVNKSINVKALGCPSLRSRRMTRVESGTSMLSIFSSGKKRSKSKEGKGRKKWTKTTPTKRTFPASETDGDADNISQFNLSQMEFRKNKHPKFKRGLRSYLWSPVNKDEDSESDDDYLSHAEMAEDSNIIITGYHLVQIVIDLLQSIGEMDVSNSMIGPSVSATILPHLLFFLKQFREENKDGLNPSPKSEVDEAGAISRDIDEISTEFMESISDEEPDPLPWSGVSRLLLLKQVVRASLTLSGIVATQQNGVRILGNLKVIETLLDKDILDSLAPGSLFQTSFKSDAQPSTPSNALRISVFRDMVCGAVQLLQVVYLHLPINPSFINDANNLVSHLLSPEISKRIKNLIHVCNFRTPVSSGSTGDSSFSESRFSKSFRKEAEDSVFWDLEKENVSESHVGQNQEEMLESVSVKELDDRSIEKENSDMSSVGKEKEDSDLSDGSKEKVDSDLGDGSKEKEDSDLSDGSKEKEDSDLGDGSKEKEDSDLSDGSKEKVDSDLGDGSKEKEDSDLGDGSKEKMDSDLGDGRKKEDSGLSDGSKEKVDSDLGDGREKEDSNLGDGSKEKEDSDLSDGSKVKVDSDPGDGSKKEDSDLGDGNKEKENSEDSARIVCEKIPGETGNQNQMLDPGGEQTSTATTQDTSMSCENKSTSFEGVSPHDASSEPVRCIGAFITTLKSIKVNYIHATKCLKRRHHNCGYGCYYDHHHDILGLPYYSSQNAECDGYGSDSENASLKDEKRKRDVIKPLYAEPTSQVCIVSQLSNLLLDCISLEGFKAGHVYLLSTIRSVGLCCCLQPDRIISSLVPHLPWLSPAVRSYALDTLTSILLDQLQGAHENQTEQLSKVASGTSTHAKGWEKAKGATNESSVFIPPALDSNRCVHCFLEGSSPLLAGLPTTMDSGFSSCDIEEMRRQRLLERWKSLRLLRKNIVSSDESIALTCAKHLMTLAIRGNSEIKEELFFGVYLHILHMKVKISGVCHPQGPEDCNGKGPEAEKVRESSTADYDGENAGIYEKDFQLLSEMTNSTDLSSTEEIAHDSTVPSSVMLLCVSALPYVLQVDKVMSMFLSRGGLAKLTDLLEYNQLRSPVMSVFEALVMIDEKRLRGNPANKKSLYEGGGVIQTFIDNLAKRTCNVTATLQLLNLQSTKETAPSSPSLVPEDSSILDLYKKEPHGASSTDDASVKDKSEVDTAALESIILNNDPNIVASFPILLDMWRTCAKLCMNSRMFRAYYRESPCLYVVQETLVLALTLVGNLNDSSECRMDTKKGGNCDTHFSPNVKSKVPTTDLEETSVIFCHQNKLEFIEAVMMVCFSCHTISPYQKRGEEDELWLRLNSALQSCIRLEHSKLSAVFQMLLNVALPRCPSVLEYSYSQIVSMLNLRDRENISDEDEVENLLQHGYDEDVEVQNSEKGYDADTESSVVFDWKKSLEDNLQDSCMKNFSATTRPCFPAAFRLFVELMVACHRIASRGVILHTVALRLLQTLRSSERAIRAVCSENLLEVFISGFQEVLVHCPANGKLSTLQEIILSLVQVIAGSEISASELRLFLKLCQDNMETTNSLLSTWLAIIEKHPVAPNISAVFPVKTLMPLDILPSKDEESDDSEIPTEQVVWHHVAVEMEVPAVEWPPYEKGFSLALWMNVEPCSPKHRRFEAEIDKDRNEENLSPSSEKDPRFSNTYQLRMQESLLVAAIGNKIKMLEVWTHTRTSSLIFRLTSGQNEGAVLKEVTLYNFLTPFQWHLLTISYIDVLDGSTFVGQLTVTLDGHVRQELILDHPASMTRRHLSLPFLCVGDTRHGSTKSHTGSWKLGTLRIFKGVQLSSEFWFHLFCLGPNFGSLSLCDCGDSHVSYCPALRKHIVNAKHLNKDVLFGISPLPDLDLARASQVLLYKMREPEMYSTLITPRLSMINSHDDLGLIPQNGNNSKLLTQRPVVSAAKVRGKIKIRETNTLEKAVLQCGGIEAFLFLVAKIFEDSSATVNNGGSLPEAEQLQSKATLVLFQLLHRFPVLAQSFEELNGYCMLAKVFTSSKSIVGYPLLKVLMNAATTESVFKSNPASSQIPLIRTHPESVIQDVQVITKLLLHWRVWQKADAHVSTLLFGALEALVSPNHPYRAFNLKQMQAGNVTSSMFNIYLERIQDGQPSLSVDVSKSASMIIKSLLGSPPDLHLLMAVMDFLLLVHPAPSGFISYAPGSFYFKMWWDGMKNQKFDSSQLRRKVAKKSAKSDQSGTNKSSSEVSTDGASKLVGQKSPKFMSSDSLIESEDDDTKGQFQYPPLKTTLPSIEQSFDMDADFEESIEVNAYEHFRHVESQKPHKRTYSLRCDTPDISSSGEHDGEFKGKPSALHFNFRSHSMPLPGEKFRFTDVLHLPEKEKVGNGHFLSGRLELKTKSSPQEESEHLSEEETNDGLKGKVGSPESVFEILGELKEDVKAENRDTQSENTVASQEEQDEDVFSDENSEDEGDLGLLTLCISLLEYLTDIVKEAPSSLLDNVFNKVLSPKSLLVLAKNPSGDMRAAVMKLLGAYLSKATPALIESFLKMDGFFLLANQLRPFPVAAKHVEIATSFLLQQEFTFNKNFMIGNMKDLSPLQQAAPSVVLSLLDGTAVDPVLCKKSLVLILQLLESNPIMSTLLLELGLAETLCNLATNIQRNKLCKGGEVSQEDEETYRILLVHVQHVLCTVAVTEFGWTGPVHFQQVEELFALLRSLEEHEGLVQTDQNKKRANTARAFQISLVVKILEDIENRSEELITSSQGWFTSSGSSLSLSKPSHSLSRSTSHRLFSQSSTAYNSLTSPGTDQSDSVAKKKLQSYIMHRSSFSASDMGDFLSVHTQEDSQPQHVEPEVSTGPGQTSTLGRRGSDRGVIPKPSLLASIFLKQRKLIYASLSQSELLDRFKKVLVVATDLAVMFNRAEKMRPSEQRSLPLLSESKTHSLEDNYLKHLFDKVFQFYQNNLNKDFMSSKKRNPIMHGAKDVLRIQFTRILLCMLSCKVDFELRAYTLAFVMTEPRATDAVKILITDQQVGTELSFYLYNLLASWKDWLNMAQREFGFALMQLLRRAGFKIFSPDACLHQYEVDVLVGDKKMIDNRFRKEYMLCAQKRETYILRVSTKFDKVLRHVTDQAMQVTQKVTLLQNEERKKLIAHIKKGMTAEIQLKKQWHEIVQNLTHERAVWHYTDSYPQSWQLDATEGPGRVRKRLQRSHLGIESRFLLPEHQEKLKREKVDPPLIFLFEDDHQMSDSAALIYRLYTNEKIQHTCRCMAVSPANASKGELLVGEICLYFVADGAITGANYTQLLLGNLDQLSITWPHTEIRELHKRWYQLQDVGLEIFLVCGRTCLLAFQNTEDRDELYSLLHSSLELPNLVSIQPLQLVQAAWLNGEVTNYDYLMHLNKVGGRSYTDLMQYPVFPFILRDYVSPTLNLLDNKAYRNLKKPIAVQEKSREKKYRDNYEFLEQEANRPPSEGEMMRVAPFHYGSHYSNSGTVLHYLVRMPPFTRMFLSYQDSNFDIPDRTFHSLSTSWRLSSFDSSTDVKELIPEFFFLPEFFQNNEGFNFGLRQNGLQVNDVILPSWCDGDARLFVLVHRQALESDYVSTHLHHWLDLVFGYKQQGEEAIKAINVFHPSTYFGVDASKIKETLKRQALLTMIRTYGQTPKQLFRSPHPGMQISGFVDDSRKPYVPRPVNTVVGLRWGNYLGSPDLGPPVYCDLHQGRQLNVSKLIALPGGLIFGVEKNASILLLHGKHKDMAMQSTEVMWAGVVTWDYHDNIIRIHSNPDRPVINFMPHHGFGKITCIEAIPDCRTLFTAGTAGIINAYSMTHNSSKESCLQVRGVKKTLYGHSGPITCLVVCHTFSILVSGSADGTAIIWDLNKLTYIRSITSHQSTVHALTVSETLGDIASASRVGESSCILQLHTINASPIASQTVHNNMILCLAYSNAPEGKSVNVIAGGLKSGIIRLWSSWNLSPLRDLSKDLSKEPAVLRPIASLTFSSDSQFMMAVGVDGVVTLWSKDMKLLRTHAKNFREITSPDIKKR